MKINKLLEDRTLINKHVNVFALIKRNDKILMGLREYKKGNPVWTFPGGRCDKNETIKKTLLREVREEIGITDLNILRFIGRKSGINRGDKVYYFECATNQEPKLMESEKFLEWKWFTIDNLPFNLVDSNDVVFLKLLFSKH